MIRSTKKHYIISSKIFRKFSILWSFRSGCNMSRIAGIITKKNEDIPYLDNAKIKHLLGTKRIVKDGFFFIENQQASGKFGSLQIVMDCSIFNANDFPTPRKKTTDAQRVLLSIGKIGIVRTLSKINGRFCFAAFDTKTNTAYLARDRFGLSTLFYTCFDGLIAFSSRAKGLLALPGVSNDLDNSFLKAAAAVNYRFLDTNNSLSPFRDIKQVPPGAIVRFDDKKMQTERFASLTVDGIRGSRKTTREEYIHLYNKAVSKRLMVAKKPIFSLSGGLDSSSVVSMAHQITQEKQTAISTVHPNKLYDERKEIIDVIKTGKVNWNSVTITNPNIFEKLKKIYSSHDYPLPTVTWLNHLMLVEEAAKLGYTDLFTGLGGDELHAGEYDYFFYFFADLKKMGKTDLLDKEIEAWVKNHDHPIFRKSKNVALERMSELTDPLVPGRCLPDEKLLNRYKTLLSADFQNLNELLPNYCPTSDSYLISHSQNELMLNTMPCCLRSGRENCNLFGMQEFHPFLDNELFEFMMSVPPEQKIRGGLTKAFARQSYKGLIPEDTRRRITKTGWNAPAHEWFSKTHRDDLRDLVGSRQFVERGIYDVDSVKRMISEHETIVSEKRERPNHMMAIWQIVSLEIWLRNLDIKSNK